MIRQAALVGLISTLPLLIPLRVGRLGRVAQGDVSSHHMGSAERSHRRLRVQVPTEG